MTAEKLENLLNSGASGSLEKIIQRAKNMDSLTGTMRTVLDPDMGENLLAANVRDDGELVIVCSSSAWASRIRFESNALLDAAGRAGFDAISCRVTVSQNR
jgi:hypothetical protein